MLKLDQSVHSFALSPVPESGRPSLTRNNPFAAFEAMALVIYYLIPVLLLTSQLYSTEANMTKDLNIKSKGLASNDTLQTVYIVYMGGVSETTTTNNVEFHSSILQKAFGSVEDVSRHILYSYTDSFNGFAAVMSEIHAESIRVNAGTVQRLFFVTTAGTIVFSGMEGVVSVFKSQNKKHHTTYSWTFLGLTPIEGLWTQSSFGNGTIVGLIDTGIWPESKSFNDDGFGPIPSKWNGACVNGENFTASLCNKKLIGARFYHKGQERQSGQPIRHRPLLSPRDLDGHGTHTASTAVGRQVANASLLGVGNGTITGGAPSARVAMYKACWYFGCSDADILAAFHDAIADGVDLMSVSLGGFPANYQTDAIAIGSFHAVAKGILVSCSAGNSGPGEGVVANAAPWIFTVGASTINRVYKTDVELVNDTIVSGISINTFGMDSTHPIVSVGDILLGSDAAPPSCISTLDPAKATGKIIVCEGNYFGEDEANNIRQSGGVGYIDITGDDLTIQFATTLSSTNVDNKTGEIFLKYANSTKNPMAKIGRSVPVYNTTTAPNMAFFSSPGPNIITPAVHKPDITAPGVDILASYSPLADVSGAPGDTRRTNFNILSGTSMSCPHVAGLAALVKSVHPDWSPAAIKSAIMTTATPLNTSISGNSPLTSGAGQINPTKAADPGLVFNVTTKDYVNFLCASGYTDAQVKLVTGGNQKCPKNSPALVDLNYPSLYFPFNSTADLTFSATRTVTNVGPASSTYSLTVEPPEGAIVKVEPYTLSFSKVNEEQSFNVTVIILEITKPHTFGYITWKDDNDHSATLMVGTGYFSTGI